MNNASIRFKGSEERKAQPYKSLNSEEIIRPGTRISRIKQIYTVPGAQRLEKALENGDAIIVCLSKFNNHREHRGHRVKRHRSVLSVYSVVDYLTKYSLFQTGQIHSCLNLSKNKPQINADERRFVNLAPAYHNFFFSEQIEKT